jgi:selenocysteine lyase/cysteine desulfurase
MSRTAYFDNAATTFPKPEEVFPFMDLFYRKYGVNDGAVGNTSWLPERMPLVYRYTGLVSLNRSPLP